MEDAVTWMSPKSAMPRAGPPPSFGRVATPVMGDPTTVPEYPIPLAQPSTADLEPKPLWLKMPVELAPFFDLGFVHSTDDCPTVVLRAIDDGGSVEITGPPIAFLGLAEVIMSLCKAVPCIHEIPEEASQREAS